MTLISDKGSAFVSHVIKEVDGVLGINLKHATTKHAQTTELLQRTQASIKKALKKQVGEDHCGFNTSVLRFLITTLLIKQVLAVSQAEFSTDVFPTIS